MRSILRHGLWLLGLGPDDDCGCRHHQHAWTTYDDAPDWEFCDTLGCGTERERPSAR